MRVAMIMAVLGVATLAVGTASADGLSHTVAHAAVSAVSYPGHSGHSGHYGGHGYGGSYSRYGNSYGYGNRSHGYGVTVVRPHPMIVRPFPLHPPVVHPPVYRYRQNYAPRNHVYYRGRGFGISIGF